MKSFEIKDPNLRAAVVNLDAGRPLSDAELRTIFSAWYEQKCEGLCGILVSIICRKAAKRCPLELTDEEVLHITLEKIIEAQDKDLGPEVDKTKLHFTAIDKRGNLRRGYVKVEQFNSVIK